MRNRISISDYNGDWAYKGSHQHPRNHEGYFTREELVAFYGTLSVDGIEYTHCYWADAPASYPRKLASDAGLPVICYVFGVDLVQPPFQVQADIDEAKRLLERTAELGAHLAMITPGVAKSGVAPSEQRKWMVDGLRACAEHALKIGVTACIENLDDPNGRPLTGHGWQCRDICTEVNSPGLRLIYDCGAPMFVGEDPLEALRAMAPYVAHVHVKNNRLVTGEEQVERYRESDSGGRYTGTVLDAGDVRVDGVVKELLTAGYGGYFLVEYQGVDDPRAASQHNVEYLRGLLR